MKPTALIYQNDNVEIYRLYRKFKKGKGKWANIIYNAHVTKDGFTLYKVTNCSSVTKFHKSKQFTIKKKGGIFYEICGYKNITINHKYSIPKTALNKLRILVNKKFGTKISQKVNFFDGLLLHNYPALALFPEYRNNWSILGPLVRDAKSVKEAIKLATGFSGKHFIRTILPSFVANMNNFNVLKGLITHGEVERYTLNVALSSKKTLRKLLKNKSLLKKLPDSMSWIVRDTVGMFYHNPDFDFSQHKDWTKLHDDLAIYARKKKQENIEFEEVIKPTTIGEFEFRLAKDSYELIEWSTLMHNCVSVYSESMKRKQRLIGGIFKDEKLIYNVGLSKIAKSYRPDEIRGKMNSDLPDDLKDFFEKRLTFEVEKV